MRNPKALKVLRETFGYEDFRGEQESIVNHIIEGGNALVLMPTGGGKSLCYQVPALVRKGVTVVISPLLALMRDQVQQLEQAGVRASKLNSTITQAEARQVERDMRAGAVDLVYVAPERFATEGFQSLLSETPLALFAIDEAHCVSQWGHDFRPEYLEVGRICAQYPDVPRMALTATADEATQLDMKKRLFLEDAMMFKSSFDRPNLTYLVVEKDEPKKQLLAFLGQHKNQSGIVYCLSRQKVDDTAEYLCTKGYQALAYHAGMDKDEKDRNQDIFLKADDVIMVATVAFGMGINKPDVRFVAHTDLPASLEAYYQETGRAGRDGLPSTVWMTYGLQDVVQRRRMIDDGDGDEKHKQGMRRRLQSLVGYCESAECRRQVVLRYFGEEHPGNCMCCDRCLTPVQTYNGTVDAQKMLAASFRTGQRFGGQHLIDVLIGSPTDKVTQMKHDQVKTFGVGKDKTQNQWRHILRQLVAMGLLEAPADLHGGLVITQEGQDVMRGNQEVALVEPRTLVKSSREKAKQVTMALAAELNDDDTKLRQALKAWRARTAKNQGLPPYVVFNDQTLAHLVNDKPKDKSALGRVHGMGANRAARYADDILEIMQEFGNTKEKTFRR